MRRSTKVAAILIGTLLVQAGSSARDAYPIAGTQPSERPAGAPVIDEVRKPEGWYARALIGISRPYPASLRFLEDQGNWYTPFNHPGMSGRFDLRGLHADDPRYPNTN